jgi:hypothetical protein
MIDEFVEKLGATSATKVARQIAVELGVVVASD